MAAQETCSELDENDAVMSGTTETSSRIVVRVWLAASAITILSLVLGLTGDGAVQRSLGLISVGFIMAVGCCKAWLILRFYLGLGPAAGSWRGLFMAFLIVILVGVFASQGIIVLMMP
ncbi:cytochrome C oxidase subunit IV family protein [Thalassospira sp. SM2505]